MTKDAEDGVIESAHFRSFFGGDIDSVSESEKDTRTKYTKSPGARWR